VKSQFLSNRKNKGVISEVVPCLLMKATGAQNCHSGGRIFLLRPHQDGGRLTFLAKKKKTV